MHHEHYTYIIDVFSFMKLYSCQTIH